LNLAKILNVIGVTISLFAAIKITKDALRPTTWGDIKDLNKNSQNNATIVAIGTMLQLVASLLDP
jgi:hypothetical protein